MLEYEWGNPSAIMMAGEEPDQAAHHHHHHHHHGSDATVRQDMLAHYASTHDQPSFNDHNHHFLTNPHPHHNHHHHDNHDLSSNNNSSTFAHHHFNLPPTHHSHSHTQSQPPSLGHHHHHHHLYDPRAFGGASAYAPPTQQSILSLEGPQFMLVPKSEDQAHAAAGVCRPTAVDLIGSARIGLNLGGRTYFSSSEDDFMSRLYRRPRPLDLGAAANSPRCQAEGCNADLSHAKHYHRRHKVCEFHSKASTVIAAGLTQRFCQQCSRFHLLSEFDNGKRSCRKRLADHNRRRRKTQQQPNLENPKSSSSMPENSRANIPTSDQNISRSPPDSGAQSSSSVTVAVSPPRMSLDCFRQRSSYQGTTSSGSSSSLFFSSG